MIGLDDVVVGALRKCRQLVFGVNSFTNEEYRPLIAASAQRGTQSPTAACRNTSARYTLHLPLPFNAPQHISCARCTQPGFTGTLCTAGSARH